MVWAQVLPVGPTYPRWVSAGASPRCADAAGIIFEGMLDAAGVSVPESAGEHVSRDVSGSSPFLPSSRTGGRLGVTVRQVGLHPSRWRRDVRRGDPRAAPTRPRAGPVNHPDRGDPAGRAATLVNGSENRCSFILDKKYDELRWFRLTRVTAYGMNVFR